MNEQQLKAVVFRIKRAQDELRRLKPDLPEPGWKISAFSDLQVGTDQTPRFGSVVDETGHVVAVDRLDTGCAAGLHAPVACDRLSGSADRAEPKKLVGSSDGSVYAVPIFDRRTYDPSPVMRSVLGVACYECPLDVNTIIKDERLQDTAGKYAEIFADVIWNEERLLPQDSLDLNWPTRQIIERCNELLDDPPLKLIAEIIGKALRESVSRAPTDAPLNAVKSQLRADLGRRFGEWVARLLEPAIDALFLNQSRNLPKINSLNTLKAVIESGLAEQAVVEVVPGDQLAGATKILLDQFPESFLPELFRGGRVIVDSLKRNLREFRRGFHARDSDLAEYIRVMRLKEDSERYLATLRSETR